MSGRARAPATQAQPPFVQAEATSYPEYAGRAELGQLREEFHQFQAVAEAREKFNRERILYITVIVALVVAIVSYAVLH